MGSDRELVLTDSPPLGPTHLLDGEPRWGVTLCPQPPLETHSRLFRPWFTFRVSARALAPPSPMLLLENLQEMGHGWSSLVGRSWGIRVQEALQGRAVSVVSRVPRAQLLLPEAGWWVAKRSR